MPSDLDLTELAAQTIGHETQRHCAGATECILIRQTDDTWTVFSPLVDDQTAFSLIVAANVSLMVRDDAILACATHSDGAQDGIQRVSICPLGGKAAAVRRAIVRAVALSAQPRWRNTADSLATESA